jgi:hypothetical protein
VNFAVPAPQHRPRINVYSFDFNEMYFERKKTEVAALMCLKIKNKSSILVFL